MQNLYIDFDGVIMNTIDVSYKIMEKANIDLNNVDDVQGFYRDLDWEMLLKESKEINNAWNDIKKILDSNKFDVSILTHVNSLKEIEEKVKIIRNHFRDITIIPVPKAISKTEMLNPANAILVDDYVHNLVEWKEAGGIGVRFDLDMDGKGFPVIDHLNALIDMFN